MNYTEKKRVIIDTGFIVALLHNKDSNHAAAVKVGEELKDSCLFVSTLFVLQEICWLLKVRVGERAVISFMKLMSTDPIFIFPDLPENWIEKVSIVLGKYSDNKLDFADASLVILAEHLGTGEILSTDIKDFNILKWNGKNHFNNLFESLKH